MTTPLRILVVDDSVVYRKLVSETLATMPGVEVVGSAANGKIALQKIPQLRPDLLTLDLEMPEMDGLEVLRHLKLAGGETRAIMLSGATAQAAKATVTALELGAFDFVLKPVGGSIEENEKHLRQSLYSRIEAFDSARQVHNILCPAGAEGTRLGSVASPKPVSPPSPARTAAPITRPVSRGKPQVVALGISTGGPSALTRMLPQLPAKLGVPVLIVQHMPPVFTKSLAEDLDRRSALKVCEASPGETVEPGKVLIAPGGKQMKVAREDHKVVAHITDDPPENSCRPSVDYLFRSVCEVYGGNALGVIMTGMGSDGASGSRQLKQRGAPIVAQDQASCVVYGMPKALIDEGLADVIAPLDAMAAEIVRLTGKGV